MDTSYEKPGSFYLGRQYDPAERKLLPQVVSYDARDLTTHALCVGMTGSGKTGLCLALLEEAAIDGIPIIAIDPKGDLGNLMLTFPELRGSDFRPWVEESEAARKGKDLDALAEETAQTWRRGLADWNQQPERIERFRNAVDINLYTPGSSAGLPMTVLRSFDAPPPEVVQDVETFRERIAGAASGLLTLLGLDADPLSSNQHILLSTLFEHGWTRGENLDLTTLIRLIQKPPMATVGVFDMEEFLPQRERNKLAMSLNNLLASPAFAGWREGESLDIQRLLTTADGKPRLSILSIAHLNDAERMFFVTIFLTELLSWMRTQPGTSTLRAVFMMDEIYGYFPPTAKPPSKPPMLQLLKQARAFGLGIVLATQNPVDLDYKGLGNIGTWLVGRLQTERDKARLLEGLENVAQQTGPAFDRLAIEKILSSLGSRVFLMNNVHEDGPVVFQSRWALSYLRGPLSRKDIQRLTQSGRVEVDGGEVDRSLAGQPPIATLGPSDEPATTTPRPRIDPNRSNGETTDTDATPLLPQQSRPMIPPELPERFALPTLVPWPDSRQVYRAALLGTAACHYVRAAADIDHWVDSSRLSTDWSTSSANVWERSVKVAASLVATVAAEPRAGIEFEPLTASLNATRNVRRWQTQLKDFLYRYEPLHLFECKELKTFSKPGQDALAARRAMEQKLRELRDDSMKTLQEKYATRLRGLEVKIGAAQLRAKREGGEFYSSAMDIGHSVLSLLLGNKRSRAARTASTARELGKAARQRGESVSAGQALEQLIAEKDRLTEEAQHELSTLSARLSLHAIELTSFDLPCRKSDMRVDMLALLWVPWCLTPDGQSMPLISLPAAQFNS